MREARRTPRKYQAAAILLSLALHAAAWKGIDTFCGGVAADPMIAIDTEVPDGPQSLSLVEPYSNRPRTLEITVSAPKLVDVAPLPTASPVVDTAGTAGPSPVSLPRPPVDGASDRSADRGSTTSPALHGRLKPGKSIVYVLDRSSSMSAGDSLGRACSAVNESLKVLGPDVKFQIVAYHGTATSFGTELVPADEDQLRRAADWLGSLKAEGRSNHRDGFREAMRFRPDAVFLLTDADDLNVVELKGMADLIRHPVYLNAAVFGSAGRRETDHLSPLERFTRDRGGAVRYYARR